MQELDRIVSVLANDLVAARPPLDRAAIRPDSSLTADLGFDSLCLMELARRLSDGYRSVDLLPWIAEAMDSGDDRVASLADHLMNQLSACPDDPTHAAPGNRPRDRRLP